jgi:N utilization substance protein B
MAIAQQKFREILFQLIFSQNFSSLEEEEVSDFLMQQLKITRKIMKEAHLQCKEIFEKWEEIDLLIVRFCKSYDFSRISEVEKSILRLGLYELCYKDSNSGVPPKVVIAEAIRLTHKFATAESAGFVNAILDAVYQARGAVTENQVYDQISTPVSSL